LETGMDFGSTYGSMFRITRDGSRKSYPAAGGTVKEAGIFSGRTIRFQQRGSVMIGIGGQTATLVGKLSNLVRSVSVFVPGESDRPESPHFDDQARELFGNGKAKPGYFGNRKEFEKHLGGRKELTFE